MTISADLDRYKYFGINTMVLDLMRVEDFHYLLVVDFVKCYNIRVIHIENKEKDNTTLNAEKKYVINFSEH